MDIGYEDNVFDMPGRNVDDNVSLGYIKGYNSSIETYCACLGNMPTKVIWTTFFNPSQRFKTQP